MAPDRSDLLQGTLDMLILKVLAAGPLHGEITAAAGRVGREALLSRGDATAWTFLPCSPPNTMPACGTGCTASRAGSKQSKPLRRRRPQFRVVGASPVRRSLSCSTEHTCVLYPVITAVTSR